MNETNTINIIVCRIGKKAEVIEIPDQPGVQVEYEELLLREAAAPSPEDVGFYSLIPGVSIICHDSGRILGLEPNRDLRSVGSHLLVGPFLLSKYETSGPRQGENARFTEEEAQAAVALMDKWICTLVHGVPDEAA